MAEIARKQRNVTLYDDMAFPDYEYREFPMAVPYVNGRVMESPYDENNKAHPVVMVNSQDELDELSGGKAEVVPQNYEKTVSKVKTDDDEKDELLVKADQLGVKVDKRWSVDRIEKAIKDHQDEQVL